MLKIVHCLMAGKSFQSIVAGLDISARPLAQASVKSVGRVQITDHSPVWRVRFFIAKKLIKLQNKRCFYTLFCREISKHKLTIVYKLLGEWKLIRASAFWGLLARMASALKIKCPTLLLCMCVFYYFIIFTE